MKKYVLRMKEKPQNSSHHSSCFIWCGKAAQIKREWKGGESKPSCASLSISNMFSMKNLLFSMLAPWREKGSRSSCHLLGIHSPISLKAFETPGQACVWGNPTATMYKVVKNIILRNPWELKKYKLIFDSHSRREICKLLVKSYSFATPKGRGELLKLMCSLDFWCKEHCSTMPVFIKNLYRVMLNGSDLET